jgi:hypothetical protein
MLVKIIAMGLAPAIWKNVFHHLRNGLPDHPFAAGIFSSAEEIGYLTREFHPHQWRREEVDFLMCEPAGGAVWKKQLAFLRKIAGEGAAFPSSLVLTLSTLEHGIKQLIQATPPVELRLDNRSRFSVSDPAFIIGAFPKDFPRLQVNGHLTGLRLKNSKGRAERELAPGTLPPGSLVGFSEIEAIVREGEALAPEEWLRITLREEKARLPRGGSPGLMREGRGLFLCPGIPLARVAGARVDGVTFAHLLDLGQLSSASPHFEALRLALRKAGNRHKRRWREVTTRTRIAESKADLPVVSGGGLALVRETLAALLRARGFARCSTLAAPGEGTFREPALMLRVGPWEAEPVPAQVEEPLVVALQGDLESLFQPLDALLDWRGLPYRPVPATGPPLTPASLHDQLEQLVQRAHKARDGLTLAGNRVQVRTQERLVLLAAREKLAELLEAKEALQVWAGTLPRSVRQVLVFSHDPEEAGAVLQALPHVSRKRWFDLSPYSEPDTLGTLSLEPVRHYLEGGLMIVTAASRERLKALRDRIAGELAECGRALDEAGAAQRFFREEEARIGRGKEALARQWVYDALGAWLDEHMDALLERLGALRDRHERRWFSRALVNRVVIIPSSGENRVGLLSACRTLYPGFNAEHSRVVHVDYEALEALPAAERKVLRDAMGQSAPAPEDWEARQREALAARNRTHFEHYLGVILAELEDVRADLVIIEQRCDAAFAILEHLRRALPALAETPAIVILPEYWAPGDDQPLPWPHTRVVCLRRLGALTAEECLRHLRDLYAA